MIWSPDLEELFIQLVGYWATKIRRSGPNQHFDSNSFNEFRENLFVDRSVTQLHEHIPTIKINNVAHEMLFARKPGINDEQYTALIPIGLTDITSVTIDRQDSVKHTPSYFDLFENPSMFLQPFLQTQQSILVGLLESISKPLRNEMITVAIRCVKMITLAPDARSYYICHGARKPQK